MKTFLVVFTSISIFSSNYLAHGAKKKSAEDIIRTAEKLRAADQMKSLVRVQTKDGKKKTTYLMEVLQGRDRRAYLEFKAPDEEVGRRMLAIGTKYWSKFPDSRRVIQISRREAIGNSAFAMADLFQMNVEDDYSAKIIGEASVGKDLSNKIQLDAKRDEAPYKKIIYYVRKSDDFPVKADFFGLSGKHLKTLTIEKSRKLAGKVRPSLMKMVDKVTDGKVSWWDTKSMAKASIPESVFTKSYLRGR